MYIVPISVSFSRSSIAQPASSEPAAATRGRMEAQIPQARPSIAAAHNVFSASGIPLKGDFISTVVFVMIHYIDNSSINYLM